MKAEKSRAKIRIRDDRVTTADLPSRLPVTEGALRRSAGPQDCGARQGLCVRPERPSAAYPSRPYLFRSPPGGRSTRPTSAGAPPGDGARLSLKPNSMLVQAASIPEGKGPARNLPRPQGESDVLRDTITVKSQHPDSIADRIVKRRPVPWEQNKISQANGGR